MVEKNAKILRLIDEGLSIQEIRKKMDIEYTELNTRLRQIQTAGYEFYKTYMNNGKIMYSLKRDFDFIPSMNQTILQPISDGKNNGFHFIAAADTHYGHVDDSMDMMHMLYSYANANNIHSFVLVGDIIEGDFINKKYLRNKTVPLQLRYMLKNYPYDDYITNYILFGNHDQHSLINNGLNIMNVLCEKRYDFVGLGYGFHTLKIKNFKINLYHCLCGGENFLDEPRAPLNLYGHSHNSKMEISDDLSIHLPTCSNVIPGNDASHPERINVGALDINLKSNRKFLEIKELGFESKVKVLNTITYRLDK